MLLKFFLYEVIPLLTTTIETFQLVRGAVLLGDLT